MPQVIKPPYTSRSPSFLYGRHDTPDDLEKSYRIHLAAISHFTPHGEFELKLGYASFWSEPKKTTQGDKSSLRHRDFKRASMRKSMTGGTSRISNKGPIGFKW